MPIRKAKWRTGIVIPRDARRATPKAIRSAGITIVGELCSFLDYERKFFQLIHSSIFIRGFPRSAAHLRKASWIIAKFTNSGGHGVRVVRVGYDSTAGLTDDACGIALGRRYHQNRTSRRQN